MQRRSVHLKSSRVRIMLLCQVSWYVIHHTWPEFLSHQSLGGHEADARACLQYHWLAVGKGAFDQKSDVQRPEGLDAGAT